MDIHKVIKRFLLRMKTLTPMKLLIIYSRQPMHGIGSLEKLQNLPIQFLINSNSDWLILV